MTPVKRKHIPKIILFDPDSLSIFTFSTEVVQQ